MKTKFPLPLVAILVFAVTLHADEPNMPPADLKLKEPWATIEKKGFNDWKIRQFVYWSSAADGGSIGFRFITDQGVEFDVLVANPAYWTDAERERKHQVIYLIESGRFYLLVSGSEQEKHLFRILTEAATSLKGEDRASPKYINALIDKIRDRKPADDYWPMTKKEVDDANKQAEQE